MNKPAQKKHYTLFMLEVVFQIGEDKAGGQKFNILYASERQEITRKNLAEIQHQAMVRFKKEVEGGLEATIQDAVFCSQMYLGHMLPDEFHDGFSVREDQPPAEKPKADLAASAPEGTHITTKEDLENGTE